MNKHFYLVFNPFLDSSDEEYTQAHRFYFELRKRKKADKTATLYWGKISKSQKDPIDIGYFKEVLLQNKETLLFVSDYKHLWVGKVKKITKDRPNDDQFDSIYNNNEVEVWFEIDDFTIIENSQKNTSDRIASFCCYKEDTIISDKLTSYLSGLRYPLLISDYKEESFFSNDRLEVLYDSPLIKNNISQKVIQSITSYCIPDKVFKELPHSAKEEIIKAEIELLDNKIYNLNGITFSYLKV